MLVTRPQLILTATMTALYLAGQLFVGTEAGVAILFSLAILFGVLSIFAGGGIKSAIGCLNAALVGKFLLLGIAIKILIGQPADSRLSAPQTTALVMAIGFFGLYAGTLMQARLRCPETFSMNRPLSDEMLLSAAIGLFFVSYAAYFVSLIPSLQGAGVQAGGYLGVARGLQSLKSFSVVLPMLYLWRKNSPRWMTHPVILAILAWSVALGIFSTGKQEAMEPLAFYVLVGFLRYGWGDVRLWSLVGAAAVYYSMIIYPYANYVRWAGGRQGSLEQRAGVSADIFWRMLSDPEFRSSVTNRESTPNNYFGSASLAPFARLSMVGEADRLIYATQQQNAFTGWETIIWGFQLATPTFLYPNKPHFEAGNYLAHIVGEVAPSDADTQVSYGIMANLYNAFSFTGVLLGSVIFFGVFYFYIRLFLGEPRWDGGPSISTVYFLWLVASLQHGIVESSLSGVIAFVSFPMTIVIFYLIATVVRLFMPGIPSFSHYGQTIENPACH